MPQAAPMSVARHDVVIVGAGPTGLTLANILGLFGIRTLLVERNESTVGEPRAVSIDDESLRTMQSIGLADALQGRIVAGYGSHYFSAANRCFAKVLPDTLEYGFPRRSAFRQPVLEAQLRDALAGRPGTTLRFGTRVTGLEQDADAVRVALATADGTRDEVTARYVVACDGARSGIREALRIGMSGSTYDQRWLIVDLTGSTDRFRHTRVYCDPQRPALALPGPDGTRRYEFMLRKGEEPSDVLDDARVRALIARHSAEDARLPIARKVVYHFHARIANRWRDHRVFLAGDAAHLSPPFAGQGMNSGVRDAQNLGWKLAACLRCELGASVLDTYEMEREPHARALIRMAVRMGRVMMPRSRIEALVTQSMLRALSLYPPARDYVMQMKYKPRPYYARGFVAGGAGAALRGRLFPQPPMERRDGTRTLLDAALRTGFAVVEWDDGVAPLATPHERGPLRVAWLRVIPHDHRFVEREGDAPCDELRDAANVLGPLFARAGIRGVVLRPDRYVAACIERTAGADAADACLDALVAASRRPSGVQRAASPQALAVG